MHLDKSPYLNGHSHRCDWCTNQLDNLRNIYRGVGSTRFYCGKEHHQLGEQRAAEKKLVEHARLAGMVHSHWLASALVLIVAMLAFIMGGGHRAYAHDPQTHQADSLADAKSDAFGVCCNGNDYTKVRVQEWETTDTGYRIRWQGKWYEASRSTKVSNMDNPDGEAKVWINGPKDGPYYVRCFMPGALG